MINEKDILNSIQKNNKVHSLFNSINDRGPVIFKKEGLWGSYYR